MKVSPLTPRELEVLRLVWEGLSTREIAKRLHRSYNTVASHRYRLRVKLGVNSTAEALKVALERGIITHTK
jgi:DNA-binding CsgD family transcriptional regulator